MKTRMRVGLTWAALACLSIWMMPAWSQEAATPDDPKSELGSGLGTT